MDYYEIVTKKRRAQMSISIKRGLICFFLAIALVLTMVPLTQTANAAVDRSPTGAVTMPASRTLAIAQNTATKINFGTEYDYQNYYYYQIKPTKTGYISFKTDFTHGNSIALCNSSKKLISRSSKSLDDFFSAGSQYPYQAVINYGVKKGVTYYVRVKGASTERVSYDQPYVGTVKWTNTAVKNTKYGKTKKRALLIKRNRVKNGVIKAGSRKAQWFKITTTRKKIRISFSAKNNCGTIYAKVYYKSYGKWYNGRMYAMRSTSGYKDACTLTKTSKKKTTYYIKVYPDYRSSGAYKLKWK